MKVLALESSAGIAGVALLEDEKILYYPRMFWDIPIRKRCFR